MMPWQDTSSEAEQIRFLQRWLAGRDTVTALCAEFGISRKTGHARIRRYQAHGWAGLGDRSRAPRHHPNQTDPAVARQVVQAKQAHPTWGPKKVVAWLRAQQPETPWPAPSTAGTILERAGLVEPRQHRRRTPPWSQPFAAADHPNDVWCLDFKGWFRTGDGTRVDPCTVVDAYSRYLLVCHGLAQPRSLPVRQVLERAFREYGLPWTIRSDNGPPFAGVGLGGLTTLGVWWVKLGILPERIVPGHPEQNGRLERFHRTLKAETASPPQATLRRQQRAFDAFRRGYNEDRPHEALGQQPPARRYRPSPRPYPRRVASPEYGPGTTVRRVRTNGEIKWRGRRLYVSEALRGEPIGLTPVDDHSWLIQFGPLQLGLVDLALQRVVHTPVQVLPMSPV
jgi:transposase InsO family protein